MIKRTLNTENFEVREAEDAKYIEGYFSVFDKPYQISNYAYETIDKHAFDGALDDDIRALINHDTGLVLGRTKAGTLELSVDDIGLFGRITINTKDSDAMNLYERVKRGDVSQCSFGFEILEENTEFLEDNKIHWTVKAVKLYEVSVVTFPAYEDTSVSARSAQADALIKQKELDAWKEMTKNKLKGVNSNGN